MSHEIEKNMFVAARGIPAWHKLGTVMPEGVTVKALPAYNEHMPMVYDEVAVTIPGVKDSGYKAVIRRPMDDETEVKVMGIVSDNYRSLMPRTLCEIADSTIERGVETMAMLRQGRIFFITFALPDFTIGGDAIKNYLAIENDMSGKGGVGVYVTGVRVVCSNTLMAGKAAAVESHMIVHGSQVEDDTRAWMSFLWDRTMTRYDLLRQTYQAMAERPVEKVEYENIKWIMLPNGNPGQQSDMPETVWERKAREANRVSENNAKYREVLDRLWTGAAIGYGPERKPESAWDLWQCYTELRNHWSSRKSSPAVQAASVMGGYRRVEIEKAYEVIHNQLMVPVTVQAS